MHLMIKDLLDFHSPTLSHEDLVVSEFTMSDLLSKTIQLFEY